MSNQTKATRYQNYLDQLDYPEYAFKHGNDSRGDASPYRLNLSLWNDELPPGVADVVMDALPRVAGVYKFAQDAALIRMLAGKLGTDDIIITAGADDALRIVAQYCLRPGSRALLPTPCFGRLAYHAMVHESKICYLRFDAYPYEFDVTRIIKAVDAKKIDCLLITNPNNPTGHRLSAQALQQLLDQITCTVILDESLLLGLSGGASTFVARYPNLFVCGSFSKSYGLAGLRIGYIVAHPAHVSGLQKLMSPFGVDALCLEVAKHALAQDEWLRQKMSAVENGIAILRGAAGPEFSVTRTSAPVALVEYTGAAGNLYRRLQDKGIATIAAEEFPGFGKANAVRVIIKNVEDMLQLTEALATVA